MTGPLPCRFRDIPESAENLPKSEKMKFRQVGGTATTTNLSLSDETRGENKNHGAPKDPYGHVNRMLNSVRLSMFY